MSVRPPGIVTCLAVLVVTDVLPRILGLRRTFSLVERMAMRERSLSPADEAHVCDRTAHAVSVAAAFYPRRAECLEQSLTLYFLLRRRGVPADLRIGVRPRPFFAHAWVEVHGRAIGEAIDLPANLVAFPTMGA